MCWYSNTEPQYLLDIVINWDFTFHFTPMEAAWAEPWSCTEMVLLVKTEVSCDGYYRLSNQETTEQLETYFLSANQAWDNLDWFLDDIQNNRPVCFKPLVLCVLLSWCSLSHKAFFSLYERVKQNRSMLWNDKGSAVKFNVMLLILFLWRGRGGEIVFRCNNLEEFIRVFERRNKRHKNDHVLFWSVVKCWYIHFSHWPYSAFWSFP